jgi:hypothetical protein
MGVIMESPTLPFNDVSYHIVSFLIPNPQHTVSLYTFVFRINTVCRRSPLVGISIVNFLSHREESGLQCIICLVLHAPNLRYTTLFTTAFDLRRHGSKNSWTCILCRRSDTWDDIVPTTGVFPDKVFCTKCTEEEFVVRCSGAVVYSFCISASSN